MAKKSDDKALKNELFSRFREAHAEVVAAQAATKELEVKRDSVVTEIVKAFGPGPYKVDGNLLTARKRGEGFYFRGMSLDGEEV